MKREVLRGIVFLHRLADKKDFNEVINCIPDSRMKELEEGLRRRTEAGEITSVQIGRHRKEIHPLSKDYDTLDAFFAKIDLVRLHSSTERATSSEDEDDSPILSEAPTFTGFDDIPDK